MGVVPWGVEILAQELLHVENASWILEATQISQHSFSLNMQDSSRFISI